MTVTSRAITGAEVRAARETLGLTIEQLARQLDVTTNTVWRWESGASPVAHPGMLRLALAALVNAAAAGLPFHPAPDEAVDALAGLYRAKTAAIAMACPCPNQVAVRHPNCPAFGLWRDAAVAYDAYLGLVMHRFGTGDGECMRAAAEARAMAEAERADTEAADG